MLGAMTAATPQPEPAGNRPVVHLIAGTRPEAIKVAPVAQALAETGLARPVIVATGQHPTLVHQALEAFGMRPDAVVQLDRNTGSQPELVAQLTQRLDELFAEQRPDAVLVQGDTTSTFIGALTAFWRKIPVVHLEAGLRSGDLFAPFPEEANRRLVTQITALHLPPTPKSAANLAAEGTSGETVVTVGNTVIDAVLTVARRQLPWSDERVGALVESGLRIALVTAHRRESWGQPLDRVLDAVRTLVNETPDLGVVLPAHPNPAVRAQVEAGLAGLPRTVVCDPLPYATLSRLLSVATLVLSDSGGIQEEAPSFGVPVLVLRTVTERTEAIDAGSALLVGTDEQAILDHSRRLLADPAARATMTAAGNPFGDGHAAQRSARAIGWLLGRGPRPQDWVPSEIVGALG